MRLVGDYSLGPLLGRGGTGEVYAGEYIGPDARRTGTPVAVKLLRPELAVDAAMVDAFVGEATRTRDIVHPNIVRVLDFGTDAGRCYLVMERLAGESLAARVAREGALPEATVRAIGAQIADGMQAAHDRGIVHRDLKPGNIMLDGDLPTVIDFGVAKSLGAGSAVVTSRRVGTLAYMAPEQLAQGLITPAIDIWALGAILFEAVTGRAPFSDFAEGRLPQLVETPVSPATLAPVSADLASLILACLDRSVGRRPSSMAELARRLAGGADERITVDAGPVLAPARDLAPDLAPARSRARRPRWTWVVAGAALAAIVTMVAVLAMTRSEAMPEAVPAALPASAPRPALEPEARPNVDDAIVIEPDDREAIDPIEEAIVIEPLERAALDDGPRSAKPTPPKRRARAGTAKRAPPKPAPPKPASPERPPQREGLD